MDRFSIRGGVPLRGEVAVSGSKNAALALMAASWLTTRRWSSFSIPISRALSSVLIRVSGMPVILEMTSAITSSSTTPSFSRDFSRHCRVIASFFLRSLSA